MKNIDDVVIMPSFDLTIEISLSERLFISVKKAKSKITSGKKLLIFHVLYNPLSFVTIDLKHPVYYVVLPSIISSFISIERCEKYVVLFINSFINSSFISYVVLPSFQQFHQFKFHFN
uniref:Uncharacterized protein n=1 Tax=Cacopsylla melanoneura TaxID=428564 RepID=A0A8D9AJ95_9HEMI